MTRSFSRDCANLELALLAFLSMAEAIPEDGAFQTERDFLAAVLERVDALVVVFDREGRIVSFNPSCEATTGYSFAQVKGKCFWDLFLITEEIETVKQVFQQICAGNAKTGENFWVSKDGTRRLIAWSNNVIVNSEGAVDYIVSTGIDITSRKQAEAEKSLAIASLRESEERFRCLIDQARDGIFAIDSSGWFVEVNQRACQDLGYSYAEMLSLGLWDLDSTWTRERFAELFQQQTDLSANDTFEADIKRKDGSIFPVEIRVGLLEWNHQQYILALVRDITKRKRFEHVQTGLIEFLEESDSRFRQMAENIRDIFWMRAVNPLQILYISPAYEEIWSRSCLSLYQKPDSFLDAIHGEDRDRAIAAFTQQIQGQSTSIEYKILRNDGSIRWVNDRGFPIRNGAGQVYRVTGIIEDITERKLTQIALQQAKEELEMRVRERTAALLIANEQLRQEISDRASAELALAKSQQELELFFSQSLDGFFFMMLDEPVWWDDTVDKEKVLDYVFAHQRIAKINDAMLAQYGATKEKFIGLTPKDLFNHDLAHGRQLWHKLFDVGRLHVETEERKLDGAAIWIEGDYICLYDTLGRIIGHFGVQRDISDRRQAEEEIRNALIKEKQLNELKSRFITMASHEFRTPLSTILSSADLLEYYIQDNSTVKQLEHIQRIQTACLNMTQMLNDILVIGRAEVGKLEFNPSQIDLVEFCRDLVEEMQLSAGYQHKITFELGNKALQMGQLTISPSADRSKPMPPSPQLLACLDRKLLRYIMTNLLSNAIKYSHRGGSVYLKLDYQESSVILEVKDEGIGIPKSDQNNLFEPFYRGKNVEKLVGTGLGLAIVKRSVDLHGGKIDFKSKIGRGTTFTVKLPWRRNC